jgi:cytochrome b
VYGPRAVIGYLRDLWHGRELRSLGHNPLGGVMVVGLLVTLLGICVSGWMMTLDIFWGDERLEELHEIAANLLVFGLVLLHLAGVLFTSLSERVNRVRAMITGIKHLPEEDGLAERKGIEQARP